MPPRWSPSGRVRSMASRASGWRPDAPLWLRVCSSPRRRSPATSRGSRPGWATRSCAASSGSAGCSGPSRKLRGGPFVNSLRWRYGAQGPGVGSYAEPGLVRATPEVLWERCRRVFNRGNAVLVLDGAPPHRLGLGLADGSFLPPAPAVSVESEFPAAYQESADLVLSGVVERSHEAGVAASLLEKSLVDVSTGRRVELTGRYAWWGWTPEDARAGASGGRPRRLPGRGRWGRVRYQVGQTAYTGPFAGLPC